MTEHRPAEPTVLKGATSMQRERIQALLKEFVTQLDGQADPPVPDEATFKELGVDSLSLVDLFFKLERELQVQIPDEEISEISTVGDLLDHITGGTAPTGQL